MAWRSPFGRAAPPIRPSHRGLAAVAAAAALGLAPCLATGARAASDENLLIDCAALYAGIADFRARTPAISVPAEPALRLARAFTAAARRLSDDPDAVTAEIARRRPDMELLNEAYTFGDRPSLRLYQRLVERCSEIGADLPETRALIRK